MLCDTHCHLDFDRFDHDRDAALERAGNAGVERILDPGVDFTTSRAAVRLADQYPQVFAAVGVHPSDAGQWGEESLTGLRALAAANKVRAIGEIGLDYYWERSSPVLQRQIFQDQLELAGDLGLPVVIHIRDKDESKRPAMTDVLAILRNWVSRLRAQKAAYSQYPGILHAFSGDVRAAEEAVELGFGVGIGGPVTYKSAERLRAVVQAVPLENIFLETDAPFLPPVPHRGERNEPAYIRLIGEQIAKVRAVEPGEVFRATSANAERLFHW